MMAKQNDCTVLCTFLIRAATADFSQARPPQCCSGSHITGAAVFYFANSGQGLGLGGSKKVEIGNAD